MSAAVESALAGPPQPLSATYERCGPECQAPSPRHVLDSRRHGYVPPVHRALPGTTARRPEPKPSRADRKAAAKARRTRG